MLHKWEPPGPGHPAVACVLGLAVAGNHRNPDRCPGVSQGHVRAGLSVPAKCQVLINLPARGPEAPALPHRPRAPPRLLGRGQQLGTLSSPVVKRCVEGSSAV